MRMYKVNLCVLRGRLRHLFLLLRLDKLLSLRLLFGLSAGENCSPLVPGSSNPHAHTCHAIHR